MAEYSKKLLKKKSGLKLVAVDDSGFPSPFLLDEPYWVPDEECSQCLNCNTKFDFFQRRHHCRRCGKCFCSKCCATKCPLPRMCFVDPVLHCERCVSVTTKENDFFQTQIKTLLQGAILSVTSSSGGPDQSALYRCHLSNDHRYIVLEAQERNPFHTASPIELKRIESACIITIGNSSSGVSIKYTESDEQPQDIQLAIVDKVSSKQPMLWLTAFHRATKMMFECRTGSTGKR